MQPEVINWERLCDPVALVLRAPKKES